MSGLTPFQEILNATNGTDHSEKLSPALVPG